MEPLLPDAFNADDFQAQKQANYDKRIVTQALRACCMNAFYATQAIRGAKEELGSAWFNTNYRCPVAIETLRVRARVNLSFLVNDKLQKTEHYQALQEAILNYPDRPVAVVFDNHGDGMPDLVIHNALFMVGDGGWQMRVVDSNGQTFWIEKWKEFLSRLSEKFKPDL